MSHLNRTHRCESSGHALRPAMLRAWGVGRSRRGTLAGAALVLAAGGCQAPAPGGDPVRPQQAAFMKMMLPRSIEVQRYLTRPIRYEGTGPADAVEVILAAMDPAGDPMKAVGTFLFELHTVRPASGDPAGERIGLWSVAVDSPEAMDRFWDRAVRYFRFPLKLDEPELAPGDYILRVTFISPWDDKLFAEYRFSQSAA